MGEIVDCLRRMCPKFEPDDGDDTPVLLLAEFGNFVLHCIARGDEESTLQVAAAVDTIFAEQNEQLLGAVESGMFEQICDNTEAARTFVALLGPSAAVSFKRIFSWAGSGSLE